MEYTVSLASVLQDASQHFARSRGAGTAKALLREYGACFLWGIATVLLAVHRFAVAASLRIRTASLTLWPALDAIGAEHTRALRSRRAPH